MLTRTLLVYVCVAAVLSGVVVDGRVKRTASATCDYDELGEKQFGTNEYTEYLRGDQKSRLIITAPHGGSIIPSNSVLRTRTPGCFVAGECIYEFDCGKPNKSKCPVTTSKDLYTKEMAKDLQDKIEAESGLRPHLIINHLHRRKMDANRDIKEGTLGQGLAKQAWRDFHGFIELASCLVTKTGGGLLLDIHGMTQKDGILQLGYLFSRSKYNDNNLSANRSSIRFLSSLITQATFDDVIRGTYSLGSFMQEEGYETFPSPNHRTRTGKHYNGGYIVRHHGSLDVGSIVDAIQVEHPKWLRNSDNAPTYLDALARAVVKFLQYYDVTE